MDEADKNCPSKAGIPQVPDWICLNNTSDGLDHTRDREVFLSVEWAAGVRIRPAECDLVPVDEALHTEERRDRGWNAFVLVNVGAHTRRARCS